MRYCYGYKRIKVINISICRLTEKALFCQSICSLASINYQDKIW